MQVVTAGFGTVLTGDHVTTFGQCLVGWLSFQKTPHVLHLSRQGTVGNVVEAFAQDEPHPNPKNQLSQRKDAQIP